MNNIINFAGRGRTTNILLLERDPLVRSAAAAHLRRSGFAVMECVNDAEALALLRSGRSIDLVCGDLDGSTKVDGTGLAAVLQHDFPRLKVLLGPAAGAHCRGLSDLEHTVKALLGRSP